ncbi:interactor of constitutive active ROPs 2, chloroplastic-like [Salvia splendens]|uniref:interactor of constitutive active ROPs 2, chloroplastic-like n=1 Tax=Salvia splendens TaxID=180675 RepID=UPI001101D513|nr:interactor of constitutive active ROPs 2, chloroplastic-like [Salvia splendens]
MQTATSRGGGGLVKSSASTLKSPRKLKPSASSVSSINPSIKTAKTIDRRLPPTHTQKKRITQIEEDLKKTKEQLSSSESWKRRAQQEAEEAKKQVAAMAAELVESQNQLKELSECEEARLQELRKISQERDREWQSELEAFQKQYSMDSAALAAAMNEIQKLKMHLNKVSHSEATQARHAESAHVEVQSLRLELTETLVLVERLKKKLNDSRDCESQALDEVSRAEKQLEVVKNAENEIKLKHDNVLESYNSLLLDLEKSNGRVKSLEELVVTLQTDLDSHSSISANSSAENMDRDIAQLNTLKSEVDELRSALGDAERRYRDEYIQSMMQIRDAYQLVELTRSESSEKEAQLEAKLRESREEIVELRIKLVERENAVQISKREEGDQLQLEVLKASLFDKESLLQATAEENERLKCEIMKMRSIAEDEALELAESSRAAEKEALLRLNSLAEEADKSCKKVARVTEQLDAAQASNTQLEAELRRLKVQCDQWRKAAEAAAAMLSTSNNGERRGSFDYHSITSKLSSSQSDDEDDDSLKKNNGNMLKKIRVLLTKGHK